MAIRTRINPKTGKKEYKVRYYWKDDQGKRKDSETGWFLSEAKAKKEAQILAIKKEELAEEKRDYNLHKTVNTAMEEWLVILQEKANRETTENTTSDVSLYNRARALLKMYTSEEVKRTRITRIEVATFRKWVNFINSKPISGNTVRHYKQTIREFNRFLADSGYYLDPNLDMDVDIALERVKIKQKNYGSRKRYCPTVTDVENICNAYYEFGIEEFKNFYWYTLFYVLFYSGMRVEELIGLQWKSVHLDVTRPYIDIQNAISEREKHSNVVNRMNGEVYHLKNNRSEREIPIFEFYYEVLEDYKYKYKKEFGLKNIQDCYVFPNITARDKSMRLDYQKQKNLLRELNRITEACGVQKTDCQMFRHGCATFLVTDKEHGGLGFTESQAKDYFGHTSDTMLNDVYAKLSKRQRAQRTSETFKGLSKHHSGSHEENEITENKKISERVADPKKNEEIKYDAIYGRITMELLRASRKKVDYHYTLKNAFYVIDAYDELISSGVDFSHTNLILDRTEMDDINFEDMKNGL